MSRAETEVNIDWKQVFEAISDLALIVDSDHRILSANRAVERITGLTCREIIGRKCYEIFHGKDQPPSDCPHKKLISSGRPEANQMEMEFLGSVYLVTVTPIFDASGKVIQSIHLAKDITAQKKSEENYRLHFMQVNDVIYSIDPELKVLTVSPSVEKLLGYTPDELIGRPFHELNVLAPEYFEKAFSDIMCVLSGNKISASLYEFIAKDGTRKFGEVSGAPLILDNKVTAVVSVARDVSDRKRIEENMKRESDFSESLINSLPGVFYLFDETGKFLRWNKNFENVSGYTADEIARMSPVDFFSGLEKEYIAGQIQKVFINGRADAEAYIVSKLGNKTPHYFTGFLIHIDEKPHLIGMGIDITDQKKMEAQIQQTHKLESIGTLAGGIAHDFNNIIGIILGSAELAIHNVPAGNAARMNLETVRTACFRARDLVTQILRFSSKSEHKREPVLLNLIITESLKMLRSSIPASIDIQTNIDATPRTILADPVQIHQVIINLCTNAVHAMKEKGGVIEVHLTEISLDKNAVRQYPGLPSGQYMQLSVRDTGQGIDPKILDRIFDPYFTTKNIGEGSGMGLAVVHGIVKNHGGAITVYSDSEKGSTFRILFPRVESDPLTETERSIEAPRGKDRILYVDDEPAMAEIGKQMLEYLGYRVESKNNPIEALELFKADPHGFDLVMTDMTMPQMTGKALAQAMMRIRPEIPVIINSGYSDQMDERKAREAGIAAYILKPLNMTQLAEIIRSVLCKK
jgi:PAS domain S-box-containing protein